MLVMFQIPDGSSLPSDVADKFEEIVESANANITATINISGVSMVNFTDLQIVDISATGAIAHDDSQGNITVTLQY